MATTFQTKHGVITVGKPYYLFPLGQVVDLKLIRHENQENGWGVSKPYPVSTELTSDLLSDFADQASKLL
ncbi:hypothetical protein VV869_23640 [Photobacterium sp. MCCC 1A19761]|uniref:hypothetical protein n=1 Tax=Photobacterium sp. MCCC 1A19761 TaxID=3115000 RepID=UPI00307F8622